MTKKLRLGVLASHGGTNLQAIIDACCDGSLDAEIRVVISNNSGALALRRASKAGIPTAHLSAVTHRDPEALDEAITATLAAHGTEVVVLAGYMKKLGDRCIRAYRNRILNVHPALLPKYGGRGMYGERVHAAVLASDDRVSGATIHLVNDEYDQGPIVSQQEVPVHPGDSVDTLAARVLELEHSLYVTTLQRIATGEVDLDRVAIHD